MSRTNTECTGCGDRLWRDTGDDDYKQPWCGSCYDQRESILEHKEILALVPRIEACVFSCDREHGVLRANLAELRRLLHMPPVKMKADPNV